MLCNYTSPIKSVLITVGGEKHVIGNVVKLRFNDKIIKLEAAMKYGHMSAKELLKILNLKIFITFVDKDKNENNKINKQKDILTNRLNESIDDIIDRLVKEYYLKKPLDLSIMDLIKYLIAKYKKNNPKSRPVYISSDLCYIQHKIPKGYKYFKYKIGKKKVPSNIKELCITLLKLQKINKKQFVNFNYITYKYPQLDKNEKIKINKQMKKIKDKLNKDIKIIKNKQKDKQIEKQILYKYIKCLIDIEYLLMDHLIKIEYYYIKAHEQINLIKKHLIKSNNIRID